LEPELEHPVVTATGAGADRSEKRFRVETKANGAGGFL
jgi:hypothetical protein